MIKSTILGIALIYAHVIGSLYAQSNDSAHGSLSSYVGVWKVNFGGQFATRTFEWGPNQSLIRFTSTRPDGEGNQIPEQEGLFIFNGVSDEITNIGAYLNGPGAMYIGKISNYRDKEILREIEVNYQQGTLLPWSDGARAPAGGTSLKFRLYWNLVDENTFEERFHMFKDGRWVNPISPDGQDDIYIWKRSE